jgi:hypothetical protein
MWSFRVMTPRWPGFSAGASNYAPLFALGASLARRGILARFAIGIGISTVAFACAIAIAIARRGTDAPIHTVPLVASSALAWGSGFLLAFSSAAHALRRDRTEGVQHLLVARTTSLRSYVIARIGGLAAVIAVVVAGGTLLTGLVAIAASTKAGGVPRTLQATGAAVVFSIAFAAVVAPVAFAALGARSRMGGYFFLLFVIVLPELFAGLLSGVLPDSLLEVIAIPSALAALRSALAPGSFDALRTMRALVAIALWILFASFLVRRTVGALDRGEGDA